MPTDTGVSARCVCVCVFQAFAIATMKTHRIDPKLGLDAGLIAGLIGMKSSESTKLNIVLHRELLPSLKALFNEEHLSRISENTLQTNRH